MRRVVLTTACMAALAAGLLPPAHAEAAGRKPFKVYMAPSGSDAADGRTPNKAVRSLARVQDILKAARPKTNVEVRIKQGTYVAPPLSWTFYVPGRKISFLPVDYKYGKGAGSIKGRPVFRNNGRVNGGWFTARLGGALAKGGTSGLRFYYLRVEGYSDGLGLKGLDHGKDTDGGRPPYFKKTSKGLNGNVVAGMEFHRIGTRWTGDTRTFGYGAVVLTNSSKNVITNSHFTNVENAGDKAGWIHGVYVTHFSDKNMIKKSRFRYISGAAAKVRDRSTLNSVERSTFTRTGVGEYYMDEVCDEECRRRYNARAKECAGYHNRFINNRLVSGYKGGQPERIWRMSPWKRTDAQALRYAGDPGRCKLPRGETRLRTWGNRLG